MPSSKSLKPRAQATQWTIQEVHDLLAYMQQEKEAGITSEGNMRVQLWRNVGARFDDTLKNEKTTESKWIRLKKDYKAVKFLREL